MRTVVLPSTPELPAYFPSSRGRNVNGDAFSLVASRRHFGTEGAVTPGQGRAVEHEALAAPAVPGNAAVGVHLNANACWRNFPAAVCNCKLGGCQVFKKRLSYRESGGLGRCLLPAEARRFTDTARRKAAILLLAEVDEQ